MASPLFNLYKIIRALLPTGRQVSRHAGQVVANIAKKSPQTSLRGSQIINEKITLQNFRRSHNCDWHWDC